MTQPTLYKIIETNYQSRKRTKLVFLGTFEEARKKAVEQARKRIGLRYTVVLQGSSSGEFQACYRTKVKCPKCGEVIPLE